ncbi:BREX-1 system adenine-specific DNA-methyltransferase PglX [Gordonia bronchialis]|uniref:BREX-1 system adenine-specific DNA-methyltransferase PglX n=1 Tax=Gordonia bronchialis TaxID=2054 RepID=UPI001CBE7596|nr:BREX-1 system adenine-specific DNA-methyltransferase PglX [Gordonia bronchialis]UAK39180.1 BREX-1 system adenine-specific DNA-methyltransferase PglX [Gordonia bronchialis]
METAPLKSFATWARTALIREVNARIAAVLAPGSSERVEQARAVSALEKAVTGAGGGDKGRAAVADKVAYTWFNRIIALRFMDANGYTSSGAVSPPAGVEVGQPEILADAKRGVFDADTVSQKTQAKVSALLDGTQPSDDPQGEAYAQLLASQCRYWNGAMPFMFEREGDYTELLIPANLLADDSVLNRSVRVLTEGVCKDVEVIGWLYQFYISERKDEVFAGFKKGLRADADEIPSATQLFTPHWIVRYLVENSLGRLWMLNHPNSGLTSQMDYFIDPVDEETDFLTINKPEELKVIDPACGSGHMLTYAYELLYAIYEEEGYGPAEIPGLILTHNLHGTEIDPRAGALAAFALAMKARASQRTFFEKQIEPNVCVIEQISFRSFELDILVTKDGDEQEEIGFWNQFTEAATFGSLIQPNQAVAVRLAKLIESLKSPDDILKVDIMRRAKRVLRQARFLESKYSIVIANPPYMGSRNMGTALRRLASDHYPNSKTDLMTMFMVRASALALSGGYWAMINLPSWMALASSTGLREWLLGTQRLSSLVQMGRGIFGADFGSVAFVVCNELPNESSCAVYRRLYENQVDVRTSEVIASLFRKSDYNRFVVRQQELANLPGSPLAFWLAPALRDAFVRGVSVGKFANPRQGMATADNDQFLRRWWEVSTSHINFGARSREDAEESRARWFPYNKGGEFRRWAGNQEFIVNWRNDGAEIRRFGTEEGGRPRSAVRNPETYFQPSVSWSGVTVGSPGFRNYPHGFIHDVTGMSIFGNQSKREVLLAILNSTTITALLQAVAPTFNIQIGDVAVMPVIDDVRNPDGVQECVALSQSDWNDFETSWGFENPSLIDSSGDTLSARTTCWASDWREATLKQQIREEDNNRIVAEAYGVQSDIPTGVPLHRVTLLRNVTYTYGPERTLEEGMKLQRTDAMGELISYAVGCMFGRFSLDKPGLILADQDLTLRDYFTEIPVPKFGPDVDNVVPIVDGDWFEDDIVERFRQFVRAAFGDQHFEANLQFVTESLGVKSLRDYFITKSGKSRFYDDHVQRYKRRPIYWLFSSPKGSFNALIYMHRYMPSTVSTVLNEYLREFQTKLKASLGQAERLNKAKEADVLRKKLLELDAYEHEVLYPLASQQLAIDLDDGVKVNYPKFGRALKKIPGLEAKE